LRLWSLRRIEVEDGIEGGGRGLKSGSAMALGEVAFGRECVPVCARLSCFGGCVTCCEGDWQGRDCRVRVGRLRANCRIELSRSFMFIVGCVKFLILFLVHRMPRLERREICAS